MDEEDYFKHKTVPEKIAKKNCLNELYPFCHEEEPNTQQGLNKSVIDCNRYRNIKPNNNNGGVLIHLSLNIHFDSVWIR